VANTKGFVNTRQLHLHYAEHGGEFGAADASQYEALADSLWNEPRPSHIEECQRNQGDIVRFDKMTQAYGVIDKNRRLRTFFKPIPCSSIATTQRAAMRQRGRCHGEVSNLLYFERECKRW
jgi:pyocin large subunit-like protein